MLYGGRDRCGSRTPPRGWPTARCSATPCMRDGFAVEDYDGPEGRGLLLPDDGVLHPVRRCLALASELPELFEHVTGRQHRTRAGDDCPRLGAVRTQCSSPSMVGSSCCCPSSPGWCARCGCRCSRPRRRDEVQLARPVYLRDGYDYWQQLPDGRIAMGGCRDVGGIAEETARRRADARGAAGDRAGCCASGWAISAPVTHRWAARVGYTDEGLPFVGEVRPGVWAAGGYCGTGNVVGAICGRAIAQAALGAGARTGPTSAEAAQPRRRGRPRRWRRSWSAARRSSWRARRRSPSRFGKTTSRFSDSLNASDAGPSP